MSNDTLDMTIVAVLQRIKKPGFFENLVGVYEEDSKRLLNEIKQSIENSDTRSLEETAHSLKSASSSIGAPEVARLASTLEDLGENGTVQGASELWVELSERLLTSHDALKGLLI